MTDRIEAACRAAYPWWDRGAVADEAKPPRRRAMSRALAAADAATPPVPDDVQQAYYAHQDAFDDISGVMTAENNARMREASAIFQDACLKWVHRLLATPPAVSADKLNLMARRAQRLGANGTEEELEDEFRKILSAPPAESMIAERDRRIRELEEALRDAVNAMNASLPVFSITRNASLPRLPERLKLVEAAIALARALLGGQP